MRQDTGQKPVYLFCFIVVAIAVTGYFVGLQSPMNPIEQPANGISIADHPLQQDKNYSPTSSVIPATHYSEMNNATKSQADAYRTNLVNLRRNVDLLATIEITPEQKAFALESREQNRAFNGAPPTIPHAIQQMSAESCMTCHGEGFQSESLRISKMSHQFLANCTQCHVEQNPTHMTGSLFRKNTFVGLPAPNGGPRAYPNAPPMIPHSTWMRVNCTSCHGFSGQHGIRTTHPWRQNCQQCHAPSSKLDQVLLDSTPRFLPPPKINR